jgi:hypothetical protein
MFKYYNRLERIEFDNESRNALLRLAFIEDKKLNKSLNKILNSIKQKFELSSLDISDRDFKYHPFNCFERKTLKQFETFEKIKRASYIFSATFFAFLNYKTI